MKHPFKLLALPPASEAGWARYLSYSISTIGLEQTASSLATVLTDWESHADPFSRRASYLLARAIPRQALLAALRDRLVRLPRGEPHAGEPFLAGADVTWGDLIESVIAAAEIVASGGVAVEGYSIDTDGNGQDDERIVGFDTDGDGVTDEWIAIPIAEKDASSS